jgi:hypothetical protein
VYELVVGRQGKKKGVSSWQGDFSQAKETIEKRGTPADGNERASSKNTLSGSGEDISEVSGSHRRD